ncbi:MAG TPA: carbon-nitrogen hydrolase family protein [Steroidobacteraceae bacterium]|nr:carbon-nitrogen hydrolase family protein [Steroidobacteraceae bacterium]
MAAIGVVQAGSVLGDTERSLAKLEKWCGECARRRLDLAVFPEGFIGGYPKGMVFGASLGIRTQSGRDLFRQYADCAVEVPGPVTDRIGTIARNAGLHLVLGVIERDGGTLYCTALYFSRSGELLGKHRKLMPTAIERLIWGCGDGSTLGAFRTDIGVLGGLICWENYMPLARMAMYAQGVQIYCAPTVDDRDTWIPTVRHIAREGRCFVLSSCQVLTRDAYPRGWLDTAQNLPEVPIRGGSCIVGPMGEFLAEPVYGQETVISAEIDLAALTRAKFDFDVIGHYARPDVFEFAVHSRSEPERRGSG